MLNCSSLQVLDGRQPLWRFFRQSTHPYDWCASGGREAFVWEALKHVIGSVNGPLILFIRDVEKTICSSFERYEAFVNAFGTMSESSPFSALNNEGATCLAEFRVSHADLSTFG